MRTPLTPNDSSIELQTVTCKILSAVSFRVYMKDQELRSFMACDLFC